MKQKWLYAVLVLSLAVNVGVLGFYGVREYRDWRQSQQFQGKWFKPGTSRRQLNRLMADLDRNRAPYSDTARVATRELGMLALEPNPDSARLNAALDRIARCRREQSRFLHELMRAHRRLLRPEKLEFWRNRMKVEYDSILRADSSAAAQPREGR
ncbi:MAG: hypothetical protein NTX53_10745 [candidate division WOR-3 bacterium]|nr:hypothetical protein [candidate division WOR-3 bacterium]